MTRLLPAGPLVLVFAAAAAGQTSLTPETLAKIKAATVFIKVTAGPNFAASGSGFVVKADAASGTGYVVTNAHVIDPNFAADERGTPKIAAKAAVEVVFDSGAATERKVRGEVVAADAERDLAVLKLVGAKGLPAPLDLKDPPKLFETMPVFVCGFPFGGKVAADDKNPEISIGPASVSSIRTDNRGNLASVQLNGALNPGNSGGPVVAADGKLVGVAVKTIRNAGLGLAIPQQEVAALLRGRPGVVRLIPGVLGAGEIPAKLEVEVLDPFANVKAFTAHYKPATPDMPAEAAGKNGLLPGMAKLPLTIADGRATADLTLKSVKDAILLQIEVELGDGSGFTPAGVVTASLPPTEMPGGMAAPRTMPQIRLPSGQLLPLPTRRKAADDDDTGPLADLTRNPDAAVGKTVVFECLTSCEVFDRTKEYELAIETAGGRPVSAVTVNVPKDLALQLADLGVYTPGMPVQYAFAVRVTGTVKKATKATGTPVVDVTEVGFLDAAQKVTATLKPEASPPAGEPTISAVNRFPEAFVGRTLVLTGRVAGATFAGKGVGLDVENENYAKPLNLDFYTSNDLATRINDYKIPRGGLPAKVTVKVERVDAKSGRGVLGVQTVELLAAAAGEDGPTKAKTFAGGGAITYPAVTAAPAPKPAPPAGQPPAPTAADKATPPAAAAKPANGNLMIILLSVFATVATAGGGAVAFVIWKKRKAAAPAAPARPVYKRRAAE